jgi:amino acid transporter
MSGSTFRRFGFHLLPLLLQIAAAWIALGTPDLEQALGFLTGYPTVSSTLAAAQVLVWAIIGAGLAVTLLQAARELARRSSPIQRRFWEGSVLVVGMLILVAGTARTLNPNQPSMHGGSVSLAQQAVELSGGG